MRDLVKGPSHARGVLGPLPALWGAALHLFRLSIWAPGAIPLEEHKWAVPLKRFALPLYDVVLVFGGLFAVESGVPALTRIIQDPLADILGYAFTVVALVCLAGIAFPRLWVYELIAKLIVVFFMGVYLFALIVTPDSGQRDFISAIVVLSLILPGFRLWIIGTEARDRRLLRAIKTQGDL